MPYEAGYAAGIRRAVEVEQRWSTLEYLPADCSFWSRQLVQRVGLAGAAALFGVPALVDGHHTLTPAGKELLGRYDQGATDAWNARLELRATSALREALEALPPLTRESADATARRPYSQLLLAAEAALAGTPIHRRNLWVASSPAHDALRRVLAALPPPLHARLQAAASLGGLQFDASGAQVAQSVLYSYVAADGRTWVSSAPWPAARTVSGLRQHVGSRLPFESHPAAAGRVITARYAWQGYGLHAVFGVLPASFEAGPASRLTDAGLALDAALAARAARLFARRAADA
jgi:hypothetical protein